MHDVTKAPAQLGNVTIKRLSDTEWAVLRGGATIASGLSFAQVTAIIRGEVAIDSLRGKDDKRIMV